MFHIQLASETCYPVLIDDELVIFFLLVLRKRNKPRKIQWLNLCDLKQIRCAESYHSVLFGSRTFQVEPIKFDWNKNRIARDRSRTLVFLSICGFRSILDYNIVITPSSPSSSLLLPTIRLRSASMAYDLSICNKLNWRRINQNVNQKRNSCLLLLEWIYKIKQFSHWDGILLVFIMMRCSRFKAKWSSHFHLSIYLWASTNQHTLIHLPWQ